MNNSFMKIALAEARKSNADIPIGCLIEKNGDILSLAHNEKEKNNDPTAHAEIIAIREASKKIDNWRLFDCSLYVTLEPCPMCAWAILNSRVKNVYFGAYDLNYGAFGSKINLAEFSSHKAQIFGGILEEECKKLIDDYFEKIRTKR